MGVKDIPDMRFLPNEFLHKCFTFLILEYDNLDPSLLEICLTTNKGSVLADNYTADFVQHTRASAHIARRKCRVHGSPSISGSWQSASVLEGRDFCLS